MIYGGVPGQQNDDQGLDLLTKGIEFWFLRCRGEDEG